MCGGSRRHVGARAIRRAGDAHREASAQSACVPALPINCSLRRGWGGGGAVGTAAAPGPERSVGVFDPTLLMPPDLLF